MITNQQLSERQRRRNEEIEHPRKVETIPEFLKRKGFKTLDEYLDNKEKK